MESVSLLPMRDFLCFSEIFSTIVLPNMNSVTMMVTAIMPRAGHRARREPVNRVNVYILNYQPGNTIK